MPPAPVREMVADEREATVAAGRLLMPQTMVLSVAWAGEIASELVAKVPVG